MQQILAGPKVGTSGTWTLGVKIGLPTLAVLLLVLLVGVLFSVGWLRNNWSDYDSSPGWIGLGVSVAGVLAILIGSAIGYYPYKTEYHQYQPITGKVEAISSRLLAGDEGKSVSQKFVVRFEGDPQQYGIDDTRAALVKRGDTITISCIRVFEYGSEDGYDCMWGKA